MVAPARVPGVTSVHGLVWADDKMMDGDTSCGARLAPHSPHERSRTPAPRPPCPPDAPRRTSRRRAGGIHDSGTHRARAAITTSAEADTEWVAVPEAGSAACDLHIDGRRVIVIAFRKCLARDERRHVELIAATEARLLALEDRVRAGKLKDKTKIAAAVVAILEDSTGHPTQRPPRPRPRGTRHRRQTLEPRPQRVSNRPLPAAM